MGTVVTDTDKIISKIQFISSFICIIHKTLTRWLPYHYGELYKKTSYFHSQMRYLPGYLHAQKFV